MPKKIRTERFVWLDIMITLLALELMSYFYYGIRALVLGGVCVAASLLTEVICLRLMNKPFTADDLSCTSDGLMIALMLPAVFDCEIAAIACVFATGIAKNAFGGRRNMIFSPAAAAYVFLAASWGKNLLLYPEPHTHFGINEVPQGLVSSASHVFNATGKFNYTDLEILLGNFSGPSGAVSILLLLVAAVMLMLRNDISIGAFIGSIFGTALFAYILPPTQNGGIVNVFVTNMVLFASIYIISDKRIAPRRQYFAFFYGLFVAVFSYILLLTTAKENIIVIVSVLFTPVALGIRNLEKKIELADEDDDEALPEAAAEAPEVPEFELDFGTYLNEEFAEAVREIIGDTASPEEIAEITARANEAEEVDTDE